MGKKNSVEEKERRILEIFTGISGEIRSIISEEEVEFELKEITEEKPKKGKTSRPQQQKRPVMST